MMLEKNTTMTKSFKNIASDLAYQMCSIAFGIIIPRLFLLNLGSEANGLVSSITQILTYVALLEAGVGAASTQALFAPVKKKDEFRINEIMAATSRFYNRTAILYMATLLILAFVFPYTVESEINKFHISMVVLVSGIPSVISFLFQGKFKILLTAEGKNYLAKNLSLFIFLLNSILKIVLLTNGFGIIAVQSLEIVSAIVQVIFFTWYIKRHYKWLDLKAKADYDSIKQSRNALIHQVAWLITSNTDTILLAYFGGFKIVSIYTTYKLFFGVLDSIINSLINSVHFVLGQQFAVDQKKYKHMLAFYETVIVTLSFALFCIARMFILPFLKLYTAGVNDINYIDVWLPYLFAIVHILVQARSTSWETISVAGHFKKTQHQPMIEAVINLSTSLVLIVPFGIHGVLCGTIIAATYRLIAMIEYSNRKILNESPWPTYKRYLINILVFGALTVLSNMILKQLVLDSYFFIIVFAAIFSVVTLGIFFAMAFLTDREGLDGLKEYTKLIYQKIVKKN